MPRVFGNSSVHISEVDAIVENESPLFADTQYIVTEYGVACIANKSTAERAEALIAIADPKFRDELGSAASRLGYM